MSKLIRCDWARGSALYELYHDNEWGRPLHNERALFELLILGGMQAGLSWQIILNRREKLRTAFDNFEPAALQAYDDEKKTALLQNVNVIRNKLKIEAVVINAAAYFTLKARFGSLDNFLWRYVDFTPIQNAWENIDQVPVKTALSDQISKDLKKMGFKFVGSTIIYAYMQTIGMVNDHLVSCHCYEKCRKEA